MVATIFNKHLTAIQTVTIMRRIYTMDVRPQELLINNDHIMTSKILLKAITLSKYYRDFQVAETR